MTLSDEQMENEDLSKRLGRTCQLQIVLNETGDKANIDNVMAIPKGVQTAKPQSEMILFDLEEFDQATYDKLSEWTQEAIQKSEQWQKSHASTEVIAVADPATGEVVEESGGRSEAGGTPPPLRRSPSPASRGELDAEGGQRSEASARATEGSVPF